jgi:hypothetical protein
MKTLRAAIVASLLVGLACLLTAAPASAAVSCHTINAKGTGQDLGNGNTTANINGGGLLNGTTEGHFTTGTPTGSVVPISGTVTFTTKQGTLTVTVQGTLDTASGEFTAEGRVTASTGKLAGASGSLKLTGTENLATGVFTEAIVGNICADLAP